MTRCPRRAPRHCLTACWPPTASTWTSPARRAVLAKAGGNPLFLEEYVRVLRGPQRLGGGGELPIPETVQQVITARIDQLDETDRRLVGEAAVVGEPLTVAPLTALTTLDGDT